MECRKSLDYIILPEQSSTCFNKQCINLYNNKPIRLSPGVATFIETGVLIDLHPKYVIEVKNHLCYKPWRIIDKYLLPNPKTKRLTLSVISMTKCTINFGDILCHVELVPASICLKQILGNIYFIYKLNTHIYIYIYICIFFYFRY